MGEIEIRKSLKSLLKLELKLGQTMVEAPQPGFVLNQWGHYDDERLTKRLIEGFEKLLNENPGDDYLRFRAAGMLSRARRFTEAESILRALIAEDGYYGVFASEQLPITLWFAGRRDEAQVALDEHNRPFVAKWIEPRFKKVEEMFKDGRAEI